MFRLEGRLNPSAAWIRLGDHKNKEGIANQMAGFQAIGSPTRTWGFRTVTICADQVTAISNHPLPKDLRPKKELTEEEAARAINDALDTKYPNMAKIAKSAGF